jgi:hypothetical protein
VFFRFEDLGTIALFGLGGSVLRMHVRQLRRQRSCMRGRCDGHENGRAQCVVGVSASPDFLFQGGSALRGGEAVYRARRWMHCTFGCKAGEGSGSHVFTGEALGWKAWAPSSCHGSLRFLLRSFPCAPNHLHLNRTARDFFQWMNALLFAGGMRGHGQGSERHKS